MIHPCYVERVHTTQDGTTVPLAADMTTVRSLMAVSYTELIWLSVSLWRRIVRMLIKIQFSTTQSLVCSLSENWSHCPGDQQQHRQLPSTTWSTQSTPLIYQTTNCLPLFATAAIPQQYSAILDLSRLSKMDTGSISLHSGGSAYKLMFIMLLVCHCSVLCSKIDLDHNLLPRSRTKLAGRGHLTSSHSGHCTEFMECWNCVNWSLINWVYRSSPQIRWGGTLRPTFRQWHCCQDPGAILPSMLKCWMSIFCK